MAGGETQSGELPFTFSETLASLADAYREMPIPVREYALRILLPSFGLLVGSLVAAAVLDLPLLVRLPIPLLGILAVVSAVMYPKLLMEQRKHAIERSLHLLITHMTVLSTTNIDRMAVFRTLALEEEYGALSEEMHRIVQIVDTWNQSLDDACRRQAKRTPSRPLSDFLDRLAYTLGAGQGLSDFLLSEQGVIIQNYVTIYEGALENLEVMKDLYLSMILSMTFALVFAVILPILTGNSPTLTVAAVIVLFIFVQSGFAYAIRTVSPFDPVWYHPDEFDTETGTRIGRSLLAGVVGTAFALVVTAAALFDAVPFLPSDLPLALYVAFPLTPLLIPGLVIRAEEQRISGRDQEFSSFIRALGASETAKQSTTSNVLRTLRNKDFGPLTDDIDNLYKRLNMRIEPRQAWRHFTAECHSYLIQKFSEMYLIGRQMGGNPKRLGELISENMNEVLQLRERREQSTITLIGLLYGITAASTFAFFIGLQVVVLLSGMSVEVNAQGFNLGSLIHTESYNVQLIEFLLVTVILFNSLLSSLMIRVVDGGHQINSFMHFVLLTWLSALVAAFTELMTSSFLTV